MLLGLRQIMEMASIDEFLVHAKMSNRDFEARRGEDEGSSTVVVVSDGSLGGGAGAGLSSAASMVTEEEDGADRAFEWHALPMPQRPEWSLNDSTDELEAREVEAFLDWRRRLAMTEESVWDAQDRMGTQGALSRAKVTPYEKNLEVWRQLWRVVERSDVLVRAWPSLVSCFSAFACASFASPS